jgi:excisionase family DNA binding protein
MDDRLLTLNQVAEYLGVPLATLYQWRHRGEGPRGIKVGGHVRVRESELERYLDAQTDSRPAA